MALPLLGAALAALARSGASAVASRVVGRAGVNALQQAGTTATEAAAQAAARKKAFVDLGRAALEAGVPQGVAPPKVKRERGGVPVASPTLAQGIRPVEPPPTPPQQMGIGTKTAIALGGMGLTLKLGDAIKNWTESLVESQRELARFSPSIARAVALLDRQQLQLSRQSAQATGGSTMFATKGLMGLKSEMQPLLDTATTIKNILAGTLVRGMSLAVTAIRYHPVVGMIEKIAKAAEWFLGNQKPENPPLADFVNSVLKNQMGKPRNKRPGEK